MIIKTLMILNKGILNTYEDIADELDITTDFAKHLVHELVRLGYLQEYRFASCNCGMRTCIHSERGAKSVYCSRAPTIWELTEKGKYAI
ncbi:MAG: hypothetical protein JW864_07230 [Spirochaetes bacterium]|nr:hypothetical protein [Spirochaetota bacterium]